jgi:hypothetical protein
LVQNREPDGFLGAASEGMAATPAETSATVTANAAAALLGMRHPSCGGFREWLEWPVPEADRAGMSRAEDERHPARTAPPPSLGGAVHVVVTAKIPSPLVVKLLVWTFLPRMSV